MPVFRVNGELHVFSHVPKCAGTTIEHHIAARFGTLGLIGRSNNSTVSLQHLTWREVVAIFPESWISGSFAVVRHPLDRLVSAYNMRISQEAPPFPREISLTDFLDWVERRLPTTPTLLDNHLRPQVDFIGPRTRIFHLEDGLEVVVAHLDKTFGSRSDLPPLGHHDFRDPEIENLFNTATTMPSGVVERVAHLYAEDFAAFGYPVEPDRPVSYKVFKPDLVRRWQRSAWRARMLLSGFGVGQKGGKRHG